MWLITGGRGGGPALHAGDDRALHPEPTGGFSSQTGSHCWVCTFTKKKPAVFLTYQLKGLVYSRIRSDDMKLDNFFKKKQLTQLFWGKRRYI